MSLFLFVCQLSSSDRLRLTVVTVNLFYWKPVLVNPVHPPVGSWARSTHRSLFQSWFLQVECLASYVRPGMVLTGVLSGRISLLWVFWLSLGIQDCSCFCNPPCVWESFCKNYYAFLDDIVSHFFSTLVSPSTFHKMLIFMHWITHNVYYYYYYYYFTYAVSDLVLRLRSVTCYLPHSALQN
jgi:hypothetical protein